MSNKRMVTEEEPHSPHVSKLCAKTSQLSLGQGKNMGKSAGVAHPHAEAKPRCVDDPGRKRGKPDKQESPPMVDGKAGADGGDATSGRTKKPRNSDGSSAGPCGMPCLEDSDRVLLQLRIAAWQNTFPDYLPTPMELANSPGLPSAATGRVPSRRWHSSDYIAHLTEAELLSAPRRARGRHSVAAMNALVDHFNETLAKKYRLLDAPRAAVAKEQGGLLNTYLAQLTPETRHWRFLTEEDLKRHGNFDPRCSAPGFFEVMRHCGRTREIRGPGYIRRFVVL